MELLNLYFYPRNDLAIDHHFLPGIFFLSYSLKLSLVKTLSNIFHESMIPLHRYLCDITDHASSMTLFPMNFVGNSAFCVLAFCEFEPFCRIKPKSCTRLWYVGTHSGLLNVWRSTGLILPYNPVTTSTNIVYVAPKMKSHYSQYLIELRWTSHNHLINKLCVKIYISMKQQEVIRSYIPEK